MKIVYDTDLMKMTVNIVKQASEQMEEASREINRIVSHMDWTCPEKDDIDEFVLFGKKAIGLANEQIHSFARAIENAVNTTDSLDGTIQNAIEKVESVISSVLSIKPVKTTLSVLSDWLSGVFNITGNSSNNDLPGYGSIEIIDNVVHTEDLEGITNDLGMVHNMCNPNLLANLPSITDVDESLNGIGNSINTFSNLFKD